MVRDFKDEFLFWLFGKIIDHQRLPIDVKNKIGETFVKSVEEAESFLMAGFAKIPTGSDGLVEQSAQGIKIHFNSAFGKLS